ncbi:MAG: pilus assembly protein CpaB [Chloroflexus sp.]|uniref:SAF domain-containing protein n=1 Tax=Chloroflexus sp. TaxID=1904827 RepID=UPI0021DCC7BC|nr:SAF domain-containing protein [Chloroflexus sp.]GIV87581.1 MAG: pilus assembly protein CpaB [Chloroflexus sp.]
MRRGALLFLLIGLIIIIGGFAAFLLLRGGATRPNAVTEPEVPPPPTAIPLVNVVQAAVDIEANTLLNDPTLLEVVEVPITEFDEQNEFSSINDVFGKLVINPVQAGRPITRDNVRDPGLAQMLPTAEPGQPRVKAYPLIVNNLSGVADQLAVNDFVDVIATFSVERQIIRPGPQQVITVNDVDQVIREYEFGETQTFLTTKTIIQRAKVLQILRPAIPTPATPEGEAAPAQGEVLPTQSSSLPQVDASGQPITSPQLENATPGSTLTQSIWVVMLALNDQQIELLEFALQSNARIVLALRSNDDVAIEQTSGVTIDLLVREFGLPLPRPLPPRVYGEDEVFVPEPTPTPRP